LYLVETMKCFWCFGIFFFILATSCLAQQDTSIHPPAPVFKEYRFNLPEKAIEIKSIELEKTREPLHGKLSPDGNSILLRNYQKGQSVRVKVVLANGKTEEYVKSPCYIDPVLEAL
jgi:hypothetical protein